MKILVNTSNLKIGGGLQVAHSALCELRNYPQHRYVVPISEQLLRSIDVNDFPSNFLFVPYSLQPSIKTLFGRNDILDKLTKEHKIDKVFSVFGPTYWNPKVPHICGYAKPHYIYKDSPFFVLLSQKAKIKLKVKELVHLHFFKQADALITENTDVSAKLQSLFPKNKIFTVTNYYNQLFEKQEQWTKLDLPAFDGVTLLTITANYPHKNIQIIPKVIAYLKKEKPELKFRFVLSLPEGALGNLDAVISEHILFLGKVNLAQCPSLYQQADVMFLPTLLECFSASYAEAMYMETPIITSDLDFARGLCGEAAIYVDSLSAEDVAKAIVALSIDKNKQEELKIAGKTQLKTFDNFTERTKKYLEIIEKI